MDKNDKKVSFNDSMRPKVTSKNESAKSATPNTTKPNTVKPNFTPPPQNKK